MNGILLKNILTQVAMILWVSSAMAVPSYLSYQGRIKTMDGSPLEYNGVSFIFEISANSGACSLYREQVSGVNMQNSKGVFDVSIGSGTKLYLETPSSNIVEVFANHKTFNCEAGGTYHPTEGESRRLRVLFHDGTSWRRISPDTTIQSVPFAAYARSSQKLEDKVVSDFLLKAGLPVCGAGSFLSWNGSSLSCLAPTASASSLPAQTGHSGKFLQTDGTSASWQTVSAGGVSSVGVAVPSYMSSTGGPITSSGIITLGFGSQAAKTVFAAPQGASGTPDFRHLRAADLRGSSAGDPAFFNVTGACAAGEMLTYNSTTDQIVCAPYTLATSITNGLWSSSGGNVYRSTGNVGIGLNNPSEALEVSGNIKATQVCIGSDCRSAWPGSGGGGTVTSVTAGTGIITAPGAGITGAGSVAVDVGTTAGKILQVAAGDKLPVIDASNLTNISATQVSSGTLPVAVLPAFTGDVTSTAGSSALTLATVPISKGGTGATTKEAALNALLPGQSSQAGKILKTDGTDVSWENANTGTVTSVGISVPTYMSSSGGPVTTSGAITLGFSSQSARSVFAAPQGANGSPDFRYLRISDIRGASSGDPAFFNVSGACAAGEMLSYSSATDQISCQAYSLPSAVTNGLWTVTGADIYRPAGNVGIGKAPTQALDVSGAIMGDYKLQIDRDGDSALVLLNSYRNSVNHSKVQMRAARGTLAAPANLNNDDIAGQLVFNSYGNASFADSAIIQTVADGAHSTTSTPGRIEFLVTPAGSLAAGSTPAMVIKSTGNVGVGTTSPGAKLVVNGAAINDGAKDSSASATIDFSSGNLQYSTGNCQAFALHNVKSGGSYTFAVQGTTAATCSFTAFSDAGSTALTVHLPPGHTATTSGKHTVYTFIVMGTHLYAAWIPGL